MSVEAKPKVCILRDEIRRFVRVAQKNGRRVGVVMTMGALHDGHLSLVDACRGACDVCVVSIFVNPTQFGPEEDFERYPRNLEADLELLAKHGVQAVFAPEANEMYRPQHSTFVHPPKVAERLEGTHRPGHYAGVATIVLKLLHAIPADEAFFGQKDYQQCAVVKNMVRDLDVPVRIVVCPTVRDHDGLAMSSRNKYLSTDERQQALAISAALREASRRVADGETDAESVRVAIEKTIRNAGINEIDYLAIADLETLLPLESIQEAAVALIAVHVGKTRLIDNWILKPN